MKTIIIILAITFVSFASFNGIKIISDFETMAEHRYAAIQ